MASQETTRDRWAFDEPIYEETRGSQDVLTHFLKRARWSDLEGGYITQDEGGRDIKVEFNYSHLCWIETRWSHQEDQWELFRPALSDLGCDIYISELTAEEVRELDEIDEEDCTTHSRTPAPSEASKASEGEGPEQIVIYEAPRSGEQELATLAESLHISAHPPTTIMATQTQTVPAGIIDPNSRRMMTADKIAINRAIGPDRNDPPEGSPPRGPFQGQGRNPGGGGGGGLPHGGGGPPGGGIPHGGGNNNKRRGSDKLVGNPPEVFKGIRAKAESFLTFWGIYAGVNRETLPSPTRTKEASYSSHTFKGTMWPSGSSQ